MGVPSCLKLQHLQNSHRSVLVCVSIFPPSSKVCWFLGFLFLFLVLALPLGGVWGYYFYKDQHLFIPLLFA